MGFLYQRFGSNILTRKAERLIRWARNNSLSVLPVVDPCCGINPEALEQYINLHGNAGFRIVQSSRKADILLLSGYIPPHFTRRLFRIYESIPEPRYVILNNSCPLNENPEGKSVIEKIKNRIPGLIILDKCPVSIGDMIESVGKIREVINNEFHIIRN